MVMRACVLSPQTSSAPVPLAPAGLPELSAESCTAGLEFQAWARVLGGKHSVPGPLSYPGVVSPAPSLRPLPAPTFRLAGVVRLHEVARAAAQVAALGVVAEL